MQTYSQFYRQHGIRYLSQMPEPVLNPIEALVLPQGSILHYADMTSEEVGITPEEPLIANNLSAIYIEHVVDLSKKASHGRPAPKAFQASEYLREYHSKFKKLKRLQNRDAVLRNPRMLLVMNYNLIQKHYRYQETYMTDYYRWANLYETIWDKIDKLCKENDRQHFIQLHLPDMIPPTSVLKQLTDHTSRQVLERFNTESLMLLADIWQWIGDERSYSTLVDIPEETIRRINLVWLFGGKWVVLNMGQLIDWRKDPKRENTTKVTQKTPEELQKLFLRMQLGIKESAAASLTGQVELQDPAANNVEPEVVGTSQPAIPGKAPEQAAVEIDDGSADMELVDKDLDHVDTDTVDKDLEQLEALDKIAYVESVTGYKEHVVEEVPFEGSVKSIADEMMQKSLLTAAEHRRITTLAENYKKIPDPFGSGKTLAEAIKIGPNELKVNERTQILPKIKGVIDQSMLSSSLLDFDERYIADVMKKDIGNMVMNIQRFGIAVEDYKVERYDDLLDSFDVHTVKIVPIYGKPSTLTFTVPRVNKDGTFIAKGTRYRMRKQSGDLPIRKTSPTKVALTSYYSKMFVTRSERAVFNYSEWLANQVIAKGGDEMDTDVQDIAFGDVFDNKFDCPRAYSAISRRASGFMAQGYQFYFEPLKIAANFGEDVQKILAEATENGRPRFTPVAIKGSELLVMGWNNELYHLDRSGDIEGFKPLGSIEKFLNIDEARRPVEAADIGIFGEDIPIGFVLAQHIGLGNLLKTTQARFRRVLKGDRLELGPDEYEVKFSDETLVFDRKDHVNAMIFNGFNRYHRELKRYSVYAFDKKEVYANILNDNGIGPRHIREFNMLFKLWVDPITRDLLIKMNEPVDLFHLMISAVRKLATDSSAEEMDNEFMREKGYERVSGMIYFELVKAIRGYAMRPVSANASVSLHPRAVWEAITKDQATFTVKESNPIHALKEQEVTIFAGAGGRSGRSMTEKARQYHPNAMGVISEATVDSGDVATIRLLSADPNYDTLRGTSRRLKDIKNNTSKVVSTSMLLAPGADHDDPKRVNFISIQNSATTHAKGYGLLPCRTGYERVMQHRTEELYARTARQKGEVVSIVHNVMTVKYEDGAQEAYQIGRRFGKWDGEIIPHDIETRLKPGDKFEKGDNLIFNSMYFTPDNLDKKQVLFKFGTLARVVLMESTDTLEDSCAISQDLSHRLVTTSTHVRNIKVGFDQDIRNLIKVGERVAPESILCTIHNALSGNSEIFGEDAISTLSALSRSTPRAKLSGVVDKIEVIYTGDVEEMTESLRAITEKSDAELRRLNKQLGRRVADARVEEGVRVDGKPLEPKAAAIRVYITGDTGMGIGDKLVFGNQMKSIVGRVMTGVNQTEDGEAIDAKFGYQSIANRIVLSAELIGTTSTLAVEISKRVVAAYRS